MAAWGSIRGKEARGPRPQLSPGPAEVDFGEPAREGAGKRAEELRPPRPLPGTEAAGTEARPGARIARPQLGLVSPGPASEWGRGLDVTFGFALKKVPRRGPTLLSPLPRVLKISALQKASFLLPWARACRAHLARSSSRSRSLSRAGPFT